MKLLEHLCRVRNPFVIVLHTTKQNVTELPAICLSLLLAVLAFAGCESPAPHVSGNNMKLTPADLSTIRGSNYRGAGATNTTDYWLHYNAAETERDLGYANRLKLNQLRVFVNYASWEADKIAFRKNLIDLARACNRHRIGLMITIGDSASFINDDGTINTNHISEFVTDLVKSIGDEPALAFWDASNEPDYNPAGAPRDRQQKRFEIARLISATLHELDKKTPVTIGVAAMNGTWRRSPTQWMCCRSMITLRRALPSPTTSSARRHSLLGPASR